jgi:CMP/dCMP kinase
MDQYMDHLGSRDMSNRRSIVVNGDLGSGKSTVSKLLAERLSIRRISVGDLYREMAAQRGMTALQLNLHAELDDKIDTYVDELQSGIAATGEQLIVDSRLAWFYFKDAFKVHLMTEPVVAAHRVLSRPGDDVERYASVDDAVDGLASRSESERARFITRYGADKTRLRGYDLVCDTTSATPAEVVDHIVRLFTAPMAPAPMLYLDPGRVHVTDGYDAGDDLRVGYARPDFFVLGGRRRLDAAISAGERLVPATLLAEADEEFTPGVSAVQFRDARHAQQFSASPAPAAAPPPTPTR